jgi:hypothetical protein
MGLNIHSSNFILRAKKLGANFTNTVTIGRQSMYLPEEDLIKLLADYNYSSYDAHSILTNDEGYSDSFFKMLGAKTIDSIDASVYENATIQHDMNIEIPSNLKERYTTLVDGGTLEHIFNVPIAIKNYMELLQIGGHIICNVPTNNFLGHGFYQFSPELFFSVFSEPNGFQIIKMIFFIDHPKANWYEIKNPADVKDRIILSNFYPSYLLILAQRINNCPIFKTIPQQSDYKNQRWLTNGDKTNYKQNNKKKGSNALIKSMHRLFSKKLYIIKTLLKFYSETGSANKKYLTKSK